MLGGASTRVNALKTNLVTHKKDHFKGLNLDLFGTCSSQPRAFPLPARVVAAQPRRSPEAGTAEPLIYLTL
ncbi:MAG: hypothetical protein EAZ35_05100 [Sphingobacteriia bacterium]|nr:MAG: hypothetical protein EAZ35_05100 [Sphingobacteriia bacterium]